MIRSVAPFSFKTYSWKIPSITLDLSLQIFNSAPDFADIANTRVLKPNSSTTTSTVSIGSEDSKPPAPMSNSFHSPAMMASTPSVMAQSWAPNNSTPGVGSASPPLYANLSSDGQTYAQYRAKLRPTGGIYSQYSPGNVALSSTP